VRADLLGLKSALNKSDINEFSWVFGMAPAMP
jgi:hypothetical protein